MPCLTFRGTMNYPKHLHKDIQEAIILSKDPEHWWFGCSKEMIIEHFVEEEETEKYISRKLAEWKVVEEAERNSGYFRSREFDHPSDV